MRKNVFAMQSMKTGDYTNLYKLCFFQGFDNFSCRIIASKLHAFWKEASLIDEQPDELDGSEDVFGIEVNSKIHRAKFLFDTTVCKFYFIYWKISFEIFKIYLRFFCLDKIGSYSTH